MLVTTVALYRSGNATSPRMAEVRTALTPAINPDVEIEIEPSGLVLVKENSGGVSTWEQPDNDWRRAWCLHAGSLFPKCLRLWNDEPGHWLWEPAFKMPLDDYQRALAAVNALFVRIR